MCLADLNLYSIKLFGHKLSLSLWAFVMDYNAFSQSQEKLSTNSGVSFHFWGFRQNKINRFSLGPACSQKLLNGRKWHRSMMVRVLTSAQSPGRPAARACLTPEVGGSCELCWIRALRCSSRSSSPIIILTKTILRRNNKCYCNHKSPFSCQSTASLKIFIATFFSISLNTDNYSAGEI